MKVLLIKPYNSMSDHIQPPLGLAYLASSINREHDVDILDMMKQNMPLVNLGRHIIESKYAVVGFQCYSQELSNIKKMAKHLKEIAPKIVLIAGGPHPTVLPEETMRFFNHYMDYLLVGEGEKAFPQFLEKLQAKDTRYDTVPGLVWKDAQTVVVNKPEAFVEDLDQLAFPAWEMIRPQTYPPAQHGAFFKQYPIAPIITTRGCPFRCKFCSAPILSGNKVRMRTAENILAEIKILRAKYGIREIHIVDDNFTIDRKHAKKVLREIIDSGLKLSIAFPNGIRIETLDEELLDLMKKSGVYLISVGLESGSDRILKLMNKRLTVDKIEEKIEMIKKAKINIAGFFIIGFPDETKEEIRKTIQFSLRLPLLRANYFSLMPLPGTEIYNELKASGEIQNMEWDKTYFVSAPYSPRGIDKNKLRNLQREAFLRFYLRPNILIRNLMQIKSLRQIKYLCRRFYHWLVIKQ